jgi:hypothetical protein
MPILPFPPKMPFFLSVSLVMLSSFVSFYYYYLFVFFLWAAVSVTHSLEIAFAEKNRNTSMMELLLSFGAHRLKFKSFVPMVAPSSPSIPALPPPSGIGLGPKESVLLANSDLLVKRPKASIQVFPFSHTSLFLWSTSLLPLFLPFTHNGSFLLRCKVAVQSIRTSRYIDVILDVPYSDLLWAECHKSVFVARTYGNGLPDEVK